jgi:hypothetical protein
MTYTIKAIPTLYNGVQFRSRLEAKWAAFFDLMGLSWEYEPIDCDGYIPDFLVFGDNQSALVEIKPEPVFDPDSRQTTQGRAAAKALGYHFIVLTERWRSHAKIEQWKQCGWIYQYLPYAPDSDQAMSCTMWLSDNGRLDFGAEDSITNTLHGIGCSPFDGHALQSTWREAGNVVQWRVAFPITKAAA